ncbi:hypothetical protein C2E23DRAFT_861960 [Lenzites betulinus]|nr:hypothetical protein C2E23DRAFT_861960 [Lenzites betulinus]
MAQLALNIGEADTLAFVGLPMEPNIVSLLPASNDSSSAGKDVTAEDLSVFASLEGARNVLRKMENDRRRFWGRYDLPSAYRPACSHRLLYLVLKVHATRRAAAKSRLISAGRRAKNLNANTVMQSLLTVMMETSAEIDDKLSEVTKLLEEFALHVPNDVHDTLVVQLGAVRHVVAYCALESKKLCSQLADLQQYLEVLTLPRDEFRALLQSIPTYTPKGRLAEAAEYLRRVSSESQAIQDAIDAPTADSASINQNVQIQVALQSDAFSIIMAEFKAAENITEVVQNKDNMYSISELVNALSVYESVKHTVGGTLERQAKMQDALKEISHQFFAALIESSATA